MSKFKPLLAGKAPEELAKLEYPVLASAKLDGIRCIIRDGVALSRSLKPIPNAWVQKNVADYAALLEGLDGELIVGPHDEEVFRRTTSHVMSKDRTEFQFHFAVFDKVMEDVPFETRLEIATAQAKAVPFATSVHHTEIWEAKDLATYDEAMLRAGFEGTMVRSPDGPYKYGRSTLKEGTLLKVKRFLDDEAVIVGYEELMHNENEATEDALGHTERSTCKEGLVPGGTLGSIRARRPDGVEFNIGSGYSADERARLWEIRESLNGQLIKYRYFPQGSKEKPRFPTYLGIRHPDDA